MGAVEPSVWSEKPLITLNLCAKSGMLKRFASSSGAGYELVHLVR